MEGCGARRARANHAGLVCGPSALGCYGIAGSSVEAELEGLSPPSFQSLEASQAKGELGSRAPSTDHGPSALGCQGIVVRTGLQAPSLQITKEELDGQLLSSEVLWQTIQELRKEVQDERIEQRSNLGRLQQRQT